ncbi:MAG TPA: hypothetical protein VKF59_05200 [Candidatus Dormibacteraeota bacterium]|nr:hypothetical protein [Candidatus Dormibacteraeota bacterium]
MRAAGRAADDGEARLGGLAGTGRYAELFWIALAVTFPTMVVGAIARRRFPDRAAELPSTAPA